MIKNLLQNQESFEAESWYIVYSKVKFVSLCICMGKILKKQEAHGPHVAHLSDIATADMQMLCNIFPILSSQLMKRSSFKQFFILKKKIYGMPVN